MTRREFGLYLEDEGFRPAFSGPRRSIALDGCYDCGATRVALQEEEPGELHVRLIQFADERRGVVAWDAEFGVGTPATVVWAAIGTAVRSHSARRSDGRVVRVTVPGSDD